MQHSISILGSGWLGSQLPALFLKQGYRVNISTRSAAKLSQLAVNKVTAYQIDIEDLGDNIEDFLNVETVIINITSKNLRAFNDLLNAIEKSPVVNLLLISSTSVYPAGSGVSQESDSLELQSHPLLQIEKLFCDSRHFHTTVLRFAGLIGPKRHPGRFFSSGNKLRDPLGRVNLIHLDDCLNIIKQIVDKKAWGEIFNGCADSHPTKLAYYTQCASALGYPAPEFLKNGAENNKVVCNRKLKEQLGYQFIYPDLEQILW